MVQTVTVLDKNPDREQMRLAGHNVPDEGPVTLEMPAIDAAHAVLVDRERYQIVDGKDTALPSLVDPEDRPPQSSLVTPSQRMPGLELPSSAPDSLTPAAPNDTAQAISERQDTDTLGLSPKPSPKVK